MQITKKNGQLHVPDNPLIPFIEGDGIGKEITPFVQQIVDAAVEKSYGGKRKISWKEVLAGEKAFNKVGTWLPNETLEAFRNSLVGIKGPLTTPVGEGIRSISTSVCDQYAGLRVLLLLFYIPKKCVSPSFGRIPKIYMLELNGLQEHRK
jgi:isocitrate dehydrogenase